MRRDRHRFAPDFDRLEAINLLSATPGYTPTDFRDAYNLYATWFKTSGGTWLPALGTGQTIAIVDAFHDPYLAGDLAKFDANYQLPVASLTQVNQAGASTDDGWAEEEALDVEWAHVAAPGAKLIVVEAASDSLTDLMNAVNTARNIAGVSVVAMSWGSSESASETSYDSYFTTPAGHTPITFVAASGDSSAYSGAEWPSSSPYVLSVGGTTLSLSAGAYASETAWFYGGGGISQVEGEPEYQNAVQSTGFRTTPDVSINADPNTGYSVYFTAPSTGSGAWEEVGGTSASAQVWGGFIADANQGRALLGKTTLDSATQTLPALYAMTSRAFHDVTSGGNGYAATAGYDLATGLGSPIGNYVIPLLASYSGSTPLTTTTVSPSTGPGRRLRSFALLETTSVTTANATATATKTATDITDAPIPVTQASSVVPWATAAADTSSTSTSTSQANSASTTTSTAPAPSVLVPATTSRVGGANASEDSEAPVAAELDEIFDLAIEALFGT